MYKIMINKTINQDMQWTATLTTTCAQWFTTSAIKSRLLKHRAVNCRTLKSVARKNVKMFTCSSRGKVANVSVDAWGDDLKLIVVYLVDNYKVYD